MPVFGSGTSVVSVYDSNRKELILIEPDDNMFKAVYLMNFESSDRADYQVNKSILRDFMYTSFGHGLTTITVAGFQAVGIDTSNNNMASISTNTSRADDIEEYYRKHCISGPDPKVYQITTGTSAIVKKPSVYRGYMVSFSRKPMGEEKIQGYGFSIGFICVKSDESSDTGSNPPLQGLSNDRGL